MSTFNQSGGAHNIIFTVGYYLIIFLLEFGSLQLQWGNRGVMYLKTMLENFNTYILRGKNILCPYWNMLQWLQSNIWIFFCLYKYFQCNSNSIAALYISFNIFAPQNI